MTLAETLASQFASIFNCEPSALLVEEPDPEMQLQAAIDQLEAVAPDELDVSSQGSPAIASQMLRWSGRRRSSRRPFNPNWRTVSEVTIEVNIRTGNLELRFPRKPSQSVLDSLHSEKWRWIAKDGCWIARPTEANRAFAQSLKSTVSA